MIGIRKYFAHRAKRIARLQRLLLACKIQTSKEALTLNGAEGFMVRGTGYLSAQDLKDVYNMVPQPRGSWTPLVARLGHLTRVCTTALVV